MRVTGWIDAARVYGDRRVASLFFFGFASGLPLALTGATLAAWFTQNGVTLREIGLLSLIGSAYALKFLWSPLVDHLPLPLLSRRLGRRRAWMLASQILLIGSLTAIAATVPTSLGGWTVLWAVVIAFASATQDIALDAYRTEILETEKLGAGAAALVYGYRVAMLTSGGGALVIAEYAGWGVAYSAMAALMLVGVMATLVNPEPEPPVATGNRRVDQGRMAAAIDWFRSAVWGPFAEFLTRPGWIAVLCFIVLYKLGDALVGVMATPFYLKTGFSLVEVGVVTKGFGLAMTLAGAALGGIMVARLGIVRALLLAGILQAASNLVFAVQAWIGYSLPMLTATISIENLSGGMGTTAFVAYLSSLCNRAYTATQYALLSSMMAATRTFLASGGGFAAEHMNWIEYFVMTTAAAVPGLLLLWWMMQRYPEAEERG